MTKVEKFIKWLSRQWWAPINSYGPCVGLTLWRLGRHKLELWRAPSWYAPPTHSHSTVDGEFFVLYGQGREIWKRTELCVVGYNITGRKYWKWYTVRAGDQHSFSRGTTCMIWLCWETWKPGVKVTSVAEDFVLA